MMDDDPQVRKLREGLDRELAGVRATAAARERLLHRTRTFTPADRDPAGRSRRIRAFVMVPLATAAAVAAVVAVPTLLRSGPGPTGGPAVTVPAGSGPTAAETTPAQGRQATPTAVPIPSERSSRATEPRTSAVKELSLVITPRSPVVGERVRLSVRGLPSESGVLAVSWADQQTPTPKSTKGQSCSPADPSPTTSLVHTYTRPGRYRIVVTLDTCGSRQSAQGTVVVSVRSASPAVPSAVGATPAPS
jgi:hypothetical protein